jgi:hypothetical protein
MARFRVIPHADHWRVQKRLSDDPGSNEWFIISNGLPTRDEALKAMKELMKLEPAPPAPTQKMPKPAAWPEPGPTERPTHRPKTCTYCGVEDLVWKQRDSDLSWFLFDPGLRMPHRCLTKMDSQFDPCPQCGTAFCSCDNVHDEEEEDEV